MFIGLYEVLKDCSYWYYLNEEMTDYEELFVLKDCSYWYYLNLAKLVMKNQ